MRAMKRKTPEGCPGVLAIEEESGQQLLLHLQSVEVSLVCLVIFTGIHLLSSVSSMRSTVHD